MSGSCRSQGPIGHRRSLGHTAYRIKDIAIYGRGESGDCGREWKAGGGDSGCGRGEAGALLKDNHLLIEVNQVL